MPEVLIVVAKDGTTQVSVQGVAGPGCRDLTAALEKALGQPEDVQLTSEYYQEAQETGQEVQR